MPSDNPEFIATVRLIFDLYVRVGLSRRQISVQLNAEGRRFYDKAFSHSFVTQVLTNPAYVGDTHFGKTKTGQLGTFDPQGNLIELKPRKKGEAKLKRRDVADRIIKENTHEPLIDRETWNAAQAKFISEGARASFAPRNPAYYLKQIFVCGHCGKSMAARTEKNPTTGQGVVVYVCSTYIKGRCGGQAVTCGYHRITHAEAELLLLDKIRELAIPFEETSSDQARSNLSERLKRLDELDETCQQNWRKTIDEGVDSLREYVNQTHPDMKWPEFLRLRKLAWDFYCEEDLQRESFARLPMNLEEFKRAIQEIQENLVRRAKSELVELNRKLTTYTTSWAEASSRQKDVLKAEAARIEAKIDEWEPRTVLISERFKRIYDEESRQQIARDKLLAEYPALQNREKGEALRRLFQTVTLYWERTFCPARTDAPRKTSRPGRNRYRLLRDQIEWSFITSDLVASS